MIKSMRVLAEGSRFVLSVMRGVRWAEVGGVLAGGGIRLTALYHTGGSLVTLGNGSRVLRAGQRWVSRRWEGESLKAQGTDSNLVQMEWRQSDFGGSDGEADESERVTVISGVERMILRSLEAPPLTGHSARLWYEGKALELAAFAISDEARSTISGRKAVVDTDRTQRVCAILDVEFAAPPSLQDLAARVGCSTCHLSRIFSATMGMSISQYIRKCRIERAADLLATGRINVTEAAFEVGYSSLGHFSTAFRQITGCCPGLYPLSVTKPVQKTESSGE